MSEITPEDKIYFCRQYAEGKMTQGHIAKVTGMAKASIHMWIKKYESIGTDAFLHNGNKHYPKELKIQAVENFLSGADSVLGICKKYGIKSATQLRKWILMYNSQEKIKSSGTGGIPIMTKGRKTTFEERIQIVQYCISHDHNYAETAGKYQISYQQARSYTVKYEANGIESLQGQKGTQETGSGNDRIRKATGRKQNPAGRKGTCKNGCFFLKKLKEIERR